MERALALRMDASRSLQPFSQERLLMTHSPYALAKNPYVDDFIGALSSSYSTPAPETVHHHLIELYAGGRDAICKKVAEAKGLFSGLPFAHVVTDLQSFHKKLCTQPRSIVPPICPSFRVNVASNQ